MKSSHINLAGSLAAGREPFWRKTKPELAADEDTIGVSEPIDESSSSTKVLGTVLRTAGIIILISAVLWVAGYIILGLTVLPILSIGDSSWAVKWAAYPQGQTPAKTVIVSQTTPIQRGLLDRLTLLISGSEGLSTSVIVALPGQSVTTDSSGAILANGIPTGFSSATQIAEKLLGDDYMAICMAGECTTGQIIEVPSEMVMGKVLGKFTPPISIGDTPEYPTSGR